MRRRLPTIMLGRLRGLAYPASPFVRRTAAVLVDALILVESFVVALLFRFDAQVPTNYWASFWWFAVLSTAVFIAFLFEGGGGKESFRPPRGGVGGRGGGGGSRRPGG